MRRTPLLLLALFLPAGAALGQEAPPAETPPPSEAAPAPAPEEPRPPEPPPVPQTAPPAPPEEPKEGMKTLISDDIARGGYGAPALVYSRVLDRDALFLGGRGGWVANHSFVLGGGGFALMSRTPAPAGAPDIGEELRLDFGYGGLWLEYIFLPDALIHGSIGTLIGAGQVSYSRVRHERREDREVESDLVFVLDPVLAAELNVTRFFRVSLGVGYRHVGSVDLTGLRREDLSGFTGSLLLKFGRF